MSLFQTQVERQFLAGKTIDLTLIYKKYLDYFGNPTIQANILELNEQQYQGEFIQVLFVNILGYTAQPNFNFLREKKTKQMIKVWCQCWFVYSSHNSTKLRIII